MTEKRKRYTVTPAGRQAEEIAEAVTEMLADGTALNENAAMLALVAGGLDARRRTRAARR